MQEYNKRSARIPIQQEQKKSVTFRSANFEQKSERLFF